MNQVNQNNQSVSSMQNGFINQFKQRPLTFEEQVNRELMSLGNISLEDGSSFSPTNIGDLAEFLGASAGDKQGAMKILQELVSNRQNASGYMVGEGAYGINQDISTMKDDKTAIKALLADAAQKAAQKKNGGIQKNKAEESQAEAKTIQEENQNKPTDSYAGTNNNLDPQAILKKAAACGFAGLTAAELKKLADMYCLSNANSMQHKMNNFAAQNPSVSNPISGMNGMNPMNSMNNPTMNQQMNKLFGNNNPSMQNSQNADTAVKAAENSGKEGTKAGETVTGKDNIEKAKNGFTEKQKTQEANMNEADNAKKSQDAKTNQAKSEENQAEKTKDASQKDKEGKQTESENKEQVKNQKKTDEEKKAEEKETKTQVKEEKKIDETEKKEAKETAKTKEQEALQKKEQATQKVQQETQAVTQLTQKLTQLTQQMTQHTQQLAQGTSTIAKGTATIGVGSAKIAEGSALLANPYTAAAGQALITEGQNLITQGQQQVQQGQQVVQQAQQNIQRTQSEINQTQQQLNQAKQRLEKAKQELQKATEEHIKAKEDTVKKTEEHTKAEEELKKSEEELAKADEEHKKSLEELNKATQEAGKAKEELTKAEVQLDKDITKFEEASKTTKIAEQDLKTCDNAFKSTKENLEITKNNINKADQALNEVKSSNQVNAQNSNRQNTNTNNTDDKTTANFDDYKKGEVGNGSGNVGGTGSILDNPEMKKQLLGTAIGMGVGLAYRAYAQDQAKKMAGQALGTGTSGVDTSAISGMNQNSYRQFFANLALLSTSGSGKYGGLGTPAIANSTNNGMQPMGSYGSSMPAMGFNPPTLS